MKSSNFMDILIFSLGEKGFNVVKAINCAKGIKKVSCVIGRDAAVIDDFSGQLSEYCALNAIDFVFRDELDNIPEKYDLYLAVGWRWILRDIPHNKLVIFHDSLLPKYRGFSPLVNALINKEERVGVTALLGSDDYDCGDILVQHEMRVHYPTDIKSEITRISMLYASVAKELFDLLSLSPLSGIARSQINADASYSLWRGEEDYRIDWNESAENILHFISCVSSPFLGASALLGNDIVRILKAEIFTDVKIENRSVGKVIFCQGDYPVVVCRVGLLKLTDIRNKNNEQILPLQSFRNKFY